MVEPLPVETRFNSNTRLLGPAKATHSVFISAPDWLYNDKAVYAYFQGYVIPRKEDVERTLKEWAATGALGLQVQLLDHHAIILPKP